MGRSTVHYADNSTNTILKRLHNKLRPAGTPVQRVEYIIELLLLRIFEVKLKQDPDFAALRKLFSGEQADLLFSSLASTPNEQILPALNGRFFPFYARILSEARKVISGNPSDKVQDQLILIEEVFGNSNFSNNVTSGNMAEVIGLVGELDEERLLKTDLLGDAIESALSETGGTKDIGLHRTPDHIRQFMVGMVAPTFQDRTFDPTAGTGGFLFDGFEYVMESVTRDGRWPGPKAHPDLAEWFKAWFKAHPAAMPSREVSKDFYRQGVSGIEYLGMIRKMAAINFYIRGLNPGNILQGDSLALFKRQYDPESATAILANPPFGAERDQEAYPEVWAEYPKESETTILFVKLMLETLKPGGRCAVIVSEGFMTWDQNSARSLRRSLLDDADLKAIISLPQGVFVSKSGQGPKTSILYFEKPAKGTSARQVTKNVWFFKVTNDGYSMGTNRKPIPGCQLVEALELFHRHVRRSEVPPESRHAFSVPADWIRTLDPRVKERIRSETRTEITAKAEEERAKLFATLEGRIAAGKLTTVEMDDRLAQHELLWQNKLANEIARRIDRAHIYSFNLPNYRSALTPEQQHAWRGLPGPGVSDDGDSLDERWDKLQKAAPDKLGTLLSKLDPSSALEVDLARQCLSDKEPELGDGNGAIRDLVDILASDAKCPRVRLGEFLLENTDRIAPYEEPEKLFRVLGVSNEEGIFLNESLTGAAIKQHYFRVKTGEFCYNPYRVNVGSIGLNGFTFDNQIISGAYVVFGVKDSELNPRYLECLFSSPQFADYVNEKAHGGVRMNFKLDYLADWTIPLPSAEEQLEYVARAERQQAIVNGVQALLANWHIERSLFSGRPVRLGDIADIGTGTTPPRNEPKYFNGTVPWVLTAEVDECEILDTKEKLTEEAIRDCGLRLYPKETVLLAMYGQGKTRGKSAFLQCPAAITQNCAGIVITSEEVVPKYVFYFLRAIYEEIRSQDYSGGGVPHLNLGIIADIRVPIPAREEQEAVVSRLDRDMETLDGLRRMSEEAKAISGDLLNRIWEF